MPAHRPEPEIRQNWQAQQQGNFWDMVGAMR